MEDNKEQSPISDLEHLWQEDQRDRQILLTNDSQAKLEAQKRDALRVSAVKKLDTAGRITSPSEKYYAATIYQHGDTIDEYKRAYELAKEAMQDGVEKAKWLTAASEDRYLVTIGQPQKFGTQFQIKENGEVTFYGDIDPSITDDERAKYNVPPLSEAIQLIKKKYSLAADLNAT